MRDIKGHHWDTPDNMGCLSVYQRDNWEGHKEIILSMVLSGVSINSFILTEQQEEWINDAISENSTRTND